MRVLTGDKGVALVFDNVEDIDALIAEGAKMKAQLEEGVTNLPVSLTFMDSNTTEEERAAFEKAVTGAQP